MPPDFDANAAHNDGLDTLPADAQELYHTLARAGAAWQEENAPAIAQVNQRLQARVVQLSARVAEQPTREQSAASLGSAVVARAPQPDTRDYRRPARLVRFGGVRGWGATLATAVVIAAFLAIFALGAIHRPSGAASRQGGAGLASGTSSGTSSGPNSPTGVWVSLSGYDSFAEFGANDPPAIAPSDPRVVYETGALDMQQHLPANFRALVGDRNGHVTWRVMPLPVPADHIGHLSVGVSPVNAQTVFLSLIDFMPSECPANRIVAPKGSPTFCELQYTSLDGGAHWSTTSLPLADGTQAGVLAASVNSGLTSPILSDTIRLQGQRLFAGFVCATSSCTRLVTSDDGGLTWSFADEGLRAIGGRIHGAANVCDYTTANATTLYAVTTATSCDVVVQSPLTLWVSHDGGTSWSKVSQLATPNERGVVAAHYSATGAELLYMGLPRTTGEVTNTLGDQYPQVSQAISDVHVSDDGGQTWRSAPTAGIPSGAVAYFGVGLLGALSDGSVVVDVIPGGGDGDGLDANNFSGSALYAWRPGDAAWEYLGSVPREIGNLLIIPSQAGGDTLYATLVSRDGASAGVPTFSIMRMQVAR